MKYSALSSMLLAVSLVGASAAEATSVQLDGMAADASNWPQFGRTSGAQSYSPLNSINARTIGKLGLAWSYDLKSEYSVTEPVEDDGVLFVATGHSFVTALNAITGRELWRYDPKVAEVAGKKLRRAWGSRGLSYADGRVFVGTIDGRLIALEARTGKPLWSVATGEPGDERYITGAPRPFNGKVLIGHGGADFVPTRGYVTCYDAATGKQLWRFYTVPSGQAAEANDPVQQMAAETWFGDVWKAGGGGVVWHALTYDPNLNRVYIGTSNPEPYDRSLRSEGRGDNLFTAAIVALDADTGKYAWHYSVNPGDEWDFDASNDLQLATLKIGEQTRRVLMQASKNGFFYVLDRVSGHLISAEPYAQENWAIRIDSSTGRPVENPDARFLGKKPVLISPTTVGAHNWLPMAFSPRTNLVYLSATDDATLWTGPLVRARPQPEIEQRSYLKAWDPIAQKAVWQVETPGIWGGGVLVTAGDLVFQGRIDRMFNAYDARTGKQLWTFDAQAPAIAPPISYEAGGLQYVTVVTGFGGSSGLFLRPQRGLTLPDFRAMPHRVLTFAIDGKSELSSLPPSERHVPFNDPDFKMDLAREVTGAALWGNCQLCHGRNAASGGGAPDLRFSDIVADSRAFASVVHEGVLVADGMPKFDELTASQVEDIRFYIRSRAKELARSLKENQ
jgi:quinohemoprotein ethanol dehydrogenase